MDQPILVIVEGRMVDVWKNVRREWFLMPVLATCLIFIRFEHQIFLELANPLWLGFLFIWLFAAVLGSALCVVRHAEIISERLGEPYGTIILTLSITAIEVMSISAVMMHGENNPTLVRDTLFSVVMIVLGGMVGLSLLLGGLRHREQDYNLQGASAYLSVIVPLAVFSLILPDFTQSTAAGTLSGIQQIMVGLMAGGLFVTFLLLQTGRHRGYFSLTEELREEHEHPVPASEIRALPHALLLAAYMVPVVFLVEQLAQPVDYLIETLHSPTAIGGVIMAILVATPEAIGAVRAAYNNRLQRSVNIFLGSVLATIGLTVPIMLVVAWLTGRYVVLGLGPADMVLLMLTLAVSVITFTSRRTNVLQGMVHVLLFLAFLLLLFQN